MSVRYREKLAQGLALAGAYVVAAPRMQGWMVVPLLAMMGVVGSLVGLWAIYSSFQEKDKGYEHVYLGGWLRLVDRDGGAPLAGQGNFNHAQSVGALSAAAGAGLVFLGHVWAVGLVVLSIAGVILASEGRMTGKWVSQGWIHLGCLAMATAVVIQGGSVGWIIFAMVAGALFLYAHPWSPRKDWYDSGRFAIWNMALREIWWRANQPREPLKALTLAMADLAQMEQLQAQAATEGNAALHNQMTVAKLQNAEQQRRLSVMVKEQQHLALTAAERQLSWQLRASRWRVRLIGHGTGSWYPLTKWPAIFMTGTLHKESQKFEGMVYLSAHNEFVEVCFEFGLLGLLAALGFAFYGLSVTWGTALLPLVAVLISVALLNFPFTLFAEVERPTPAQPVQFVGSPALLVMGMVILLLVEAVR
jgi:hypothetical protein